MILGSNLRPMLVVRWRAMLLQLFPPEKHRPRTGSCNRIVRGAPKGSSEDPSICVIPARCLSTAEGPVGPDDEQKKGGARGSLKRPSVTPSMEHQVDCHHGDGQDHEGQRNAALGRAFCRARFAEKCFFKLTFFDK